MIRRLKQLLLTLLPIRKCLITTITFSCLYVYIIVYEISKLFNTFSNVRRIIFKNR